MNSFGPCWFVVDDECVASLGYALSDSPVVVVAEAVVVAAEAAAGEP